jgi:hypothetical protein
VFSAPVVVNDAHQGLSDDDLNIIIDYEEENLRLGNFERIFPLQSNAQHYAKFFEYERPSNELLCRYLKMLPSHSDLGVATIITKNDGDSQSPIRRKK